MSISAGRLPKGKYIDAGKDIVGQKKPKIQYKPYEVWLCFIIKTRLPPNSKNTPLTQGSLFLIIHHNHQTHLMAGKGGEQLKSCLSEPNRI